MKYSEPPMDNSPAAAGIDWGAAFLNRFDYKVRRAGHLKHPAAAESFAVNPSMEARFFKRAFGDIEQFCLRAGLLSRVQFYLTAVSLANPLPVAAKDLMQQITGPSGLDLPEKAVHCIGIFSPEGWPEERKDHLEIRGDTLYYLVQKERGTFWSVSGLEGPLKRLYDPEIPDEKEARARNALAADPLLHLPGDPVAMEALQKEHHLDSTDLLAAVRASGGIFEIVEHRGKSYIQRCVP